MTHPNPTNPPPTDPRHDSGAALLQDPQFAQLLADETLHAALDDALAPADPPPGLEARILAATTVKLATPRMAAHPLEAHSQRWRLWQAPLPRAAAMLLLTTGLVAGWLVWWNQDTPAPRPIATGSPPVTWNSMQLATVLGGLAEEERAVERIAPELLGRRVQQLERSVVQVGDRSFWGGAPGNLDELLDQVAGDLATEGWEYVF